MGGEGTLPPSSWCLHFSVLRAKAWVTPRRSFFTARLSPAAWQTEVRRAALSPALPCAFLSGRELRKEPDHLRRSVFVACMESFCTEREPVLLLCCYSVQWHRTRR